MSCLKQRPKRVLAKGAKSLHCKARESRVNRALVNAKRGNRGEEDGDALVTYENVFGRFFLYDTIKMQLVFDGFLQVPHRPG